MANLNEEAPLVVPEIQPLHKEPVTVPELKGLGAAQEPEPKKKMIGSDLDYKDIGVGLAGAPAVAGSQVLGTPGDVRAMGRAVTQWAEQPKITAKSEAGASEQARRWEETKKMIPPHAPTLYDIVSPYLFGEKGTTPIFPTSEAWYKSMPSAVKTEPKTPEGKTAQDIAAFGLSTAVGGEGGVPGFIGRTLTGSGVEALGRGLEEWQKGTDYEKYIRPVTEFFGTAIGHRAVKSMMPGVQAEKAVGEAMFKDRQNLLYAMSKEDLDSLGTKLGLTGDQVKEALRTGTKLTGLDIGGPEAERLLRESAGLSDAAKDALEKYNLTAAAPGKEVPPRLSGSQKSISNFFGLLDNDTPNAKPGEGFIPIGRLDQEKTAANKAEVKRLYEAAMKPGEAAEGAAEIGTPTMEEAENIIRNKYGQDTLDWTRENRGDEGVIERAQRIAGNHNYQNPDNPIRFGTTSAEKPQPKTITLDPAIGNDPLVQSASAAVMKDLEKTKRLYGYENVDVVPPQAGTPQVKDPFTGEMRGGSPATPGNLAFWDLVKRRMWDEEQALKKSPTTGGPLPQEMADSRRQLVANLDQQVPEYAAARDKFAEMTGSSDAAQAGYDFGRRAGTQRLNSFERAQFEDAVNAYTPEQRQIAQNGFLTAMVETTNTPGGIKSIATKLLGNKNFRDDARMILGDDKYHMFRGKMIAENARLAAKELSGIQPKGMLGEAAKATAGSAVMILPFMFDTLTQAIINAQFTPGIGTAALGVGTVGAGKAAIGAIQARRIAERIAPMLMSDDPKVISRLSQLADKDPGFARVMENIGAATSTAQMRPDRFYEKDNAPAQFAGGRVGRATGGRTGKNPKMKAESLIALANKVKKEESQNTSSFLNLDDTTVAKALAVANKHI